MNPLGGSTESLRGGLPITVKHGDNGSGGFEKGVEGDEATEVGGNTDVDGSKASFS